ncbi:MAG: UDP-2,4-diacetamido-2,4,6-trideoxy-beta-L-altropyranose hydrolase [Epsilonproteobacteria bacterium]|nr:UDP-2,4-diacetamido-2,4,6-trideoxy-beta-L-altropyranose hydrolase [Campylobacterota bacterium]
MSTVLFRADSSFEIGTGHIMRDLVLAEREFADWRVIFAVRDLPGNVYHKITEAGHEIVTLAGHGVEELAETVKKVEAETVVIDHYGIGYEDEKRLKTLTDATLFVLDDTYERHFCDILLNHNVYAEADRYKGLVPQGCEVRCGMPHTLIRREFYEAKKRRVKRDKGAFYVFVAMGGADTAGLNLPLLKLLRSFEKIRIDIVTTRANRNLAALEEAVAQTPNATLHVESERMALLMARADLAIVTPSVVLNEVIFMAVPFVAIRIASNQDEMVAWLKRRGETVVSAGDFACAVLAEVAGRCLRTVPFERLSEEERKRVWRWRNDDRIRRRMFNKKPVGWEEHLAFLERLDGRNDRKYRLVYENESPIGVVDLTKIDHEEGSAHIGLYADPSRRGKGKALMGALVHEALKLGVTRLIAEVYESNEKARRLYDLCGFTVTRRRMEAKENLLVMEREIANRNV